MNSGVYTLKFDQGYHYIGKADNIPRRWEQHAKSFEKGNHTKKLQRAYDSFGEPNYEVLEYCHQDHIDLVESLLIEQFWDDKILNGNQPRLVSAHERAIISLHTELLKDSTAQHIIKIRDAELAAAVADASIEELEEYIHELKTDGIVLPHEVAEKLTDLEAALTKKNRELERLSKLSWYDRLFNYKVLC